MHYLAIWKVQDTKFKAGAFLELVIRKYKLIGLY